MPIRTILVNFDIDEDNEGTARCAVDLARRLGARIIGHCAADITPLFVGAEGAELATAVYADLHQDIEARQRRAQQVFKTVVPTEMSAGWLAPSDSATASLVDHAAGADLILVARPTIDPGGPLRCADLGDVVLGSGRPVIAVPLGTVAIDLDTIVVGWKNTREARRAVDDALPLLAHAKRVVVATVDEGTGRRALVPELLGFLESHSIHADHVARREADPATALLDVCQATGSRLLVTGAYGHSRWRERLFGGVTEALMGEAAIVRLLSA